jgi:hypothetical protein
MMRSLCILFAFLSSLELFGQVISKEELKPLHFLIGEWAVEADMRLSKNGPWEKSKARSVIKMSIGETIFEEEYTGTKQGRALIARSWLGNDNRTKLYQRIWVDSDHGVLVVQEGTLENKLMTFQSRLDLNGTRLILRIQYKLLSNDSFAVESSRSTDEGKTWDRTGTLSYSRNL